MENLSKNIKCVCVGFGWGRVNFHPSSWYGAVLGICAGSRVRIMEPGNGLGWKGPQSWSAVVLEMAEPLPAMGSGEGIPCFALRVCFRFTY